MRRRYRADAEVARYQGWSPMTAGEAGAFLEGMASVTGFVPGEWIQLGIAVLERDRLVGDIGIWVDAAGREAEIGFSLARPAQGRGLAGEAVRLVVDALLVVGEIAHVRGVTDARNGPSIRLLERLGFGVRARQETVFKGEPCTELVLERSRLG